MAYLDLISPPAMGSYNRKLAQLTSLTCSVYWSEILDIGSTVVRKKKFDLEGFFKIDRTWITSRTTITLEEQLDCDAMLQNLGVLEVNSEDPNMMRLHLDTFAGILINDANIQKVDLVKKKTKVSRSQASSNKRVYILTTLKSKIPESDQDLIKAYSDWLDVVYDKGVCKSAQIQTFVGTINNFTTDKATKLKIIQLATSLSYKLADWAIERYAGKPISTLGVQKNTTDISDVEF